MKPFKLRISRHGAHIHVDVFVLNISGNTYQLAGQLVFDEWQFDKFRSGIDAEVVQAVRS